MGWESILKRGVILRDIRLLKYILRNGEFKTMDRIMDEVYDLIQENKKLGMNKLNRMQGRPMGMKFSAGKAEVKKYMTNSPDYESRDSGIRTPKRHPIMEFRYIGE